MEIVDLLNVPKDDMLLIGDSLWDLIHATGHLPQECLSKERRHEKSVRKNR